MERQTGCNRAQLQNLAEIRGHAPRPWSCILTEENDTEWKIWKKQEEMEIALVFVS